MNVFYCTLIALHLGAPASTALVPPLRKTAGRAHARRMVGPVRRTNGDASVVMTSISVRAILRSSRALVLDGGFSTHLEVKMTVCHRRSGSLNNESHRCVRSRTSRLEMAGCRRRSGSLSNESHRRVVHLRIASRCSAPTSRSASSGTLVT